MIYEKARVNPQWLIAAECDALEDALKASALGLYAADRLVQIDGRLVEELSAANRARLEKLRAEFSRAAGECAKCGCGSSDMSVVRVGGRRFVGCRPCVDAGVAAGEVELERVR